MIEGDECKVEGFVFCSGGHKVSKHSQRLMKTSKSLRITLWNCLASKDRRDRVLPAEVLCTCQSCNTKPGK